MDLATSGVEGQGGATSGVPPQAVASQDASCSQGDKFNHLSNMFAAQPVTRQSKTYSALQSRVTNKSPIWV